MHLLQHVREQLKSQAAIILGSIDFLGNPIGLISDVKAGLHAGLGQGNVQNMTKHFTHGLSNTTAKVSVVNVHYCCLLSWRIEHITFV